MSSERSDGQLLDELRFQLAVTRAMLATLELDQVLYIILSGLTHGEGLNFNRAFLFLTESHRQEIRAAFAVGPGSGEEAHRIWVDMERQRLELEDLLAAYDAAHGDPRAQALTRRIRDLRAPLVAEPPPLDDGAQGVELASLITWCAGRNRPFHSNDLRVVYRPPDAPALELTQLACVPVAAGDRVLGVIVVDNAYNHRPVEAAELRGLSTLANLAAIAIERATLHERLKEMAARDGLTGVFNRRHYETRLAERVAQAVRAGHALALLVIDIDHFKDCNDHHGHECGDQVLRDLAGALNESVRGEDLVARYGGEELVILLGAGVTLEAAHRVAEKIRAAVAEGSFGGLGCGAVTVSIGVAALDDRALAAGGGGALFRAADEALYVAKQAGRNRVEVAEVSA